MASPDDLEVGEGGEQYVQYTAKAVYRETLTSLLTAPQEILKILFDIKMHFTWLLYVVFLMLVN